MALESCFIFLLQVIGTFSLFYHNPVWPHDGADPYCLPQNSGYYGYTTNSDKMNIPCIYSDNLANWTLVGDALPNLPSWATKLPGAVWAPAVYNNDSYSYIMYYVLHTGPASMENGMQCISRAWSSTPEGPYDDYTSGPLICPSGWRNALDPSWMLDTDGTLYLTYKLDGENGNPSTIFGQQLSADGWNLVGRAKILITADQSWEAGTVEGPSMMPYNGKYYLAYSGNSYNTKSYAVGYAVCKTALGPCVKPLDHPIMVSNAGCFGPGGQEFFLDSGGNPWFMYHGWIPPITSYPGGKRATRIDPVGFDPSGKLIAYGPS